MKSCWSIPRKRRKSMMPGIVASPTPTVGISGDSMSWIEHVRPTFLANALAAIQPAVPPPTIAIRLIRPSVCMDCSEVAANAEQYAPRSRLERERQVLELQILTLVLLGQVDRFERHPEPVAELVSDLRIDLVVGTIPDAERPGDVGRGGAIEGLIREAEVAVERLVAPAIRQARFEAIVLIVDGGVEGVLRHTRDRQRRVHVVVEARFGVRVRVVGGEAQTEVEGVLP